MTLAHAYRAFCSCCPGVVQDLGGLGAARGSRFPEHVQGHPALNGGLGSDSGDRLLHLPVAQVAQVLANSTPKRRLRS